MHHRYHLHGDVAFNSNSYTMTRINVVPVEELTDNFILAEHFELPRIFLMVEKHARAGKTLTDFDIPPHYVMGKGHMTFFYDKLHWLYRRWAKLYAVAVVRGLDPKQDPATLSVDPSWFRNGPWWGDYEPTPEAIQLNRDRLQVRRRYDGGVYSPAP